MKSHRPASLTIFLCFIGFSVGATVRYVDLNNAAPASPFTSWATAATNIQQAIDAAVAGDQILVTNGVYQTGGRVTPGWAGTNRAAIDKAITVQSVNGPAVTIIQGYQIPFAVYGPSAVRGVFLANNAMLAGFTVTNGATPSGFNYGGGILCESTGAIISNCVITANASAYWGGGVFRGTLKGCTLTRNYAEDSGGGSASGVLTNCVLSQNSSGYGSAGYGGGVYNGTLFNCTLSSNSVGRWGGAAYVSTLTGCTLTGNAADNAGGAGLCFMTNCIVSGNRATNSGGGIYGGTHTNCVVTGNLAINSVGGGVVGAALFNCTLSSNSAPNFTGGGVMGGSLTKCSLVGNFAKFGGGGAESANLTNCILTGNVVIHDGGGARASTLVGCALTGNSASYGGGAENSTLYNCTLTGNSAIYGGGVYFGTLRNCILYYNVAASDPNHYGADLSFCCTTPLAGGTGNLADEPKLSSSFHLSAGSPCRNAGSAAFVSGRDIDGQTWASPPTIGCDEVISGASTGLLSVVIEAAATNAAPGFGLDFAANITGNVTASRWEFGDGTVVSNLPFASHAWAAAGDYEVVLRAYNDSFPGGVSTTSVVHIVANSIQYVAQAGTNPIPPFNSWATAATNIQDAVDVSFVGGTILVSNGQYNAGSRFKFGFANRLVVTRPLTVQSVNGPAATAIDGAGAMRCVYLANGAVLAGFTLTNGFVSGSGGGAWCESTDAVLSNCVVAANSAGGSGGGVFNGTLDYCTLAGNRATNNGGAVANAWLNHCTLDSNLAGNYGGGAHNCTLTSSTLTDNSAYLGGGVQACALQSCTLTGNVSDGGGGANDSTLSDCTLTGNRARYSGGGSAGGVLNRCVLNRNYAAEDGGGAFLATLTSCALTGNSATNSGGGARLCTLTNCTVTGNSAFGGGGVSDSTLFNSLVYFNQAGRGDNYSGNSTLNYCCTTPLPLTGTNNLAADPQLVSDSHLSAGSPCRAAGSADFASGADIDNQPWLNPPAIGCDEFYSGSVTGALSVAIQTGYTNVAAGFLVDFGALIAGSPGATRWDFGDGTVVSNQPYLSHGWAAAGDYPVTLTAFNASNPGGISATVTVHVVAQPVHYVALDSPTPLAPFTSWATAATNIQDAVDAASTTGALVLVSNGTYQAGGRLARGGLTNRLAVTKPIRVQSVNGPAFTVIQGNPTNGDNAMRCVYLTNNTTLSGFTLTLGATLTGGDSDLEQSGGGVWCESSSALVSNCVLAANSAAYSGGGIMGGTIYSCLVSTNHAPAQGGGADSASLYNCTLTGNYGPEWWAAGGGGAHRCTLNQCALVGNSAFYGGGAHSSTLISCLLTNNDALSDGGGASSCVLNDCTLAGNNAWIGGGAIYSTLDRCALSKNKASYGAGAHGSTLRSSVLAGNFARDNGGGAGNCQLNNCTLIDNTASVGGGAMESQLNNCIAFYNSALDGPNYWSSTLSFSCALPVAPGVGNIGDEPQLADLVHLGAGSPCRSAGSPAFASGADIDGDLWLNPPSIGCDQFIAGGATGALNVAISARFTNVVVGFGLDFVAQITGHASASRWEFDDGTVLSNRMHASHSWTALGDYPVVLRAFNDTYPGGISATVTVHVVTQPVHYVAASNGTPISPFTSWATAATNIQDAVDAVTTAGALVLVSNGVYTGTARLVNNDVPYRVVIDKAVIVRSVNGPATTIIQGRPYENGNQGMRCAYLAAGASLVGFTLTNGVSGGGENSLPNLTCGGVWCETSTALVSNCVIVDCSAHTAGGGAYGGTLINCQLLGNSSYQGGGAIASILKGCLLLTNSASISGGAHNSVLVDCLLQDNWAQNSGGGAGLSVLNNCTLTGNYGGNGGAVDSCSVSNSAITGNSAAGNGGGANAATLFNCTVTGNAATNSGGGVANCTNFNSLVYYNFAPNGSNWVNSTFDHGCTAPLPPAGPGNTDAEPQLADASHLSAGSPCRGAGLFANANGADIDGEPWLNPPSIGCDEFVSGAITGALSVVILTPYTNVAAGYMLSFRAFISGHASGGVWDFGDGTILSNRPFTSHSWAVPGDYTVAVTVFNDDFPSGISTNLTVHVQSPLHYVALNNLTPIAPYSSWATAATNIQDAVDATFVGGTIIVSNGIYQIGGAVASGTLSNRVAVTRQTTLQSVNGPAVTVIRGSQPNGANAVRCVSLVRDCALIGFTLSNGGTRTSGDGDLNQTGGGVWCDSLAVTISNCVITANTAPGGGAGAMRGTLYNCTVSSNSFHGAANSVLNDCQIIGNSGGGAANCTLNRCLVTRNSGGWGGGAGGGTLNNCVVSSNSASYGGATYASVMNNCLIIGNTAYQGGGIYNSWLYNCTVVSNSASGHGGGAFIASALNNSILYFNTAPNGPNYYSDYVNHCCTTPFYEGMPGNITNAPLFVNAAAGDFRLQSSSPCINSGDNLSAPIGPDFSGNPRIVGGTVDIGAYEFQNSSADAFAAWLQQYGLPTNGSADYADSDGDHMNNWQEWIAGTTPTNALSVLRLLNPTHSGSGITVTWSSVSNRTYFLERSSNLGAQPAFLTLATNIAGQSGTTSFTDTNAVGSGPFFYRVGIQTGSNQFQTAFSVISFAWLQQYGLPTDGSADYTDPDADRMNNWQEWRADTIPTDAQSVLRMLSPTGSVSGLVVSWQSVATRNYFLQRGTNLLAQPPFSTIQSNIPGQQGVTIFTDADALGVGPFYYRVGVQ